MRPLGWMSTCLSGPDPELTNLWYARRRHHDLACAHLYCVIANGEGSVTLKRHEDLLVGMGVQHCSTAGRAVNQEE